jgi:hypothetical protein
MLILAFAGQSGNFTASGNFLPPGFPYDPPREKRNGIPPWVLGVIGLDVVLLITGCFMPDYLWLRLFAMLPTGAVASLYINITSYYSVPQQDVILHPLLDDHLWRRGVLLCLVTFGVIGLILVSLFVF